MDAPDKQLNPPKLVEAVLFVVPVHLPYLERSLGDAIAGSRDIGLRLVASGFSLANRSKLHTILEKLPADILTDFTRAQNIGANRNHALMSSDYDFVAFLDADDRFHPQFGELLTAAVEFVPDADIYVHGYYFGVGSGLDELWVEKRGEQLAFKREDFHLLREEPSFPVHKGHMMVKRSYAINNMFDTSLLKRQEDTEYFASALAQGSIVVGSEHRTTFWRGGSSAFFPGVRLAFRIASQVRRLFAR